MSLGVDIAAVVVAAASAAFAARSNTHARAANQRADKANSLARDANRIAQVAERRTAKTEERQLEVNLVDWGSDGFSISTYRIVNTGSQDALKVTATVVVDGRHSTTVYVDNVAPGAVIEVNCPHVFEKLGDLYNFAGADSAINFDASWTVQWKTPLGTPRSKHRSTEPELAGTDDDEDEEP
jgi:hypothetical protein